MKERDSRDSRERSFSLQARVPTLAAAVLVAIDIAKVRPGRCPLQRRPPPSDGMPAESSMFM
ncbi:MAG: hypothetical protein E5W38_10240 [Mesorhizobium sp.]|nr:MAG: hypothetical protein E5W38_10240 [Mesorhizobium sp.]